MPSLWTQVIQDLDANRIQYCVLRDVPTAENLATESTAAPGEPVSTRRLEVDLLVAEREFDDLAGMLDERNFLRLRRWGYAPHQFFVAYDEACDLWLKLDVVTRIAFGRPAHAFRTSLADDCLAHRIPNGGVYVPAPEEEFVVLLLHCLIDEREITPARRSRLKQIVIEPLNEPRLEKLVADHWPSGIDWLNLKKRILDDDLESLLLDRTAIVRNLGRREPLHFRGRQIRDRLLRKLTRARGFLRPDVPTVALLAPDGAGKSTIAQGIVESFFFPARLVYMGMYQKNADGYGSMSIPGIGLGIRLLRQWTRYLRARFYQAGGRLVLFDRYSYDAMLQAKENEGTLSRCRRWLLAHSCPHADMVFMLDAPGEHLFERKQEHTAEILEEQRRAYRALSSRLPQMVIVDATKDVNEVRREVLSCIWRGCAKSRR